MLSLRIALRYLFSRKSHSAVNIISMISVAGILVATAAIVIIMSVFNGFSDLAESKLSVIDADLSVTRTDGRPIADADALCRRIATADGVSAVTPTIIRRALAVLDESQMPVTAIGLSDADLQAISLDSLIMDGDADLELQGWPCALLSPGVAVGLDTSNATHGDIYLYEPRRIGRVNPGNPMGAFRSDTLLVRAIYMTGDTDTDAETMIVPIGTMRSLLEYHDGEADALRVYAAPGHTIDRRAIASLLPDGGAEYTIADRLEQHAESYRMISVEKWMTFVLLAFVLVIASFNIISTMAMLIIEKQPNMHILRAMGAPRSLTDNIFMWQNWLITILGGLLGIVLGVTLCLLQQWFGLITLQASDPTVLTVDTYPVRVAPLDLLYVAAIIAAIALFTSLLTRRTLRQR